MAEIKDKKKFHIFSAAYIGSTVKTGEYGGKKEIAFIGRSNVGKSSLINSLSGMRKLAYVSREPGKTRTINFYKVNDAFYLYNPEEIQAVEKNGRSGTLSTCPVTVLRKQARRIVIPGAVLLTNTSGIRRTSLW